MKIVVVGGSGLIGSKLVTMLRRDGHEVVAAPCHLASNSEFEPQRQLDRAWSTNLIQRVEAAVRAAGSEAARQHLCRVAEQRAGEIVDWRAEVRPIEDVEELGPEAEM